ncbi:hypothetical protein R5R35_006380 [Gryllus longicercus]|uniref:Accessory gland protein n=1 Tax=Gryllus longicercus TaxID=2509291 RepID=A0AAN9VX50_9ORTH
MAKLLLWVSVALAAATSCTVAKPSLGGHEHVHIRVHIPHIINEVHHEKKVLFHHDDHHDDHHGGGGGGGGGHGGGLDFSSIGGGGGDFGGYSGGKDYQAKNRL